MHNGSILEITLMLLTMIILPLPAYKNRSSISHWIPLPVTLVWQTELVLGESQLIQYFAW
jgi:hypothetical protein